MADQTISIKDATAASKLLLAKANPDGSLSFYHVENEAQRTALLAAFAPLSTAVGQATGNAALATIASNTAGLATAAAQTTGNASLTNLASVLAPSPVSASGSISTTGVGTQTGVIVRGTFNISVWGTFVGAIRIERNLDGTNWLPLTIAGASFEINNPATEIFGEPQAGVRYRVNVVSLSSGTVNYLISQ